LTGKKKIFFYLQGCW